MYTDAQQALTTLRAQGETPCLLPQNLVEFWAVTTRPVLRNGLGFSSAQAEAELSQIEALFPVLPDVPAVFPEWRRIVIAHGVVGVNVYDARLVAAMLVHGVTHLLTFNADDFRRYSGITVVRPHEVR
jgi:predicted nucleic acid-binding protein